MKEIIENFSYKELESDDELPEELAELLVQAKIAIATAYAPYSEFRVGAAVLLENGEIVSGSNQENASSPAGICAERVALSAASSLHPNVAVIALAVSAKASTGVLTEPAAPCGICRQTILEYEQRFNHDIEIILRGEAGKIFRISSVKNLLPLYFGRDDMK
jgi:cytidine deaminase